MLRSRSLQFMSLPDLLDGEVLARLLGEMDLRLAGDPRSVGDDYGYASERCAVHITLPNGEKANAVVKAWDPAANGLGEIEFYTEWAHRLPIRLPAHFGSHATDSLAVVVLEDLEPARQGDDEVGLDLADAVAVARALGRVHATTRGMESDLAEPHWAGQLPSEWHDSRRVAFFERFGPPQRNIIRAIVVHSELAVRIGRSLLAEAPHALIHSDVHGDNIVFRDNEPVLLDWAQAGWGAAAHDLAAVLFSCSDIDDAEEVIAAHRGLSGVDDDEIDGALLLRLVVGTLGVARWFPSNPRQERLIQGGLQRVQAWADWVAARRPGLEGLLRG